MEFCPSSPERLGYLEMMMTLLIQLFHALGQLLLSVSLMLV